MNTRTQSIQSLQERQFDLLVIGGGIAGAGVAQDAALRGLSVALVEKEDFASGTSSKTTKLIHGGLRYLEQFHFKLTRELCQERALLTSLAPHMVRNFSFIMPLLKDNPWFGLKARLGLTVYDILSWSVHGAPRHQKLSQKEVLESAPALSADSFAGGLRFHDCITDDSRLVLEVVKSACSRGAVVANYLEVTGFDTEGGSVNSVKCHDRVNSGDIEIRARTVVNAAGVWSDKLLTMLDSNWRQHVTPSKGIHIIVPSSAFETNSALFLPTADRRYVFVVPWQRALMIGTTDNPYTGNLDNPMPDGDEIDYLLSVVNSYTNSHKLNRSDITGSFAGLRPLVRHPDEDESTSDMSREHLIFEGPAGIIGMTGGKLTNYRIMAQEVTEKALAKLPGKSTRSSSTNSIMLGGFDGKQDFLRKTAEISAKARRLSIEPATIEHLIANYGADAQTVVDIVEKDSSLNERICPDFPPIMAEVAFSTSHEMTVSLQDLLMRRLRLGILHQQQCMDAAPKVAEIMKLILKWDEARTTMEIDALERSLDEQMELTEVPVA